MNAQGKPLQEKKVETSFTRWFSADGIFHMEPFKQWLASEIDILRLAAGETASKKVETIMEEVEEVEEVSSESRKNGKSRKGKKWCEETSFSPNGSLVFPYNRISDVTPKIR